VMRLARFNVEQAGRAKTHFHGLPSPMAGLTLATYYWFSQTPLYQQTVILFTDDKTLADLPWPRIMGFLMAILAALMISDVPYPAFPQVGYKTTRQRLGSLVVLGGFAGLVFLKSEFIFPAMIAYVAFGLIKFFAIGLLDRSKSPEEIYWTSGGNGPADLRDGTTEEGRFARRRRRRRTRNPKPGPPFPPSAEPRDQQGP